MKRAILIISVIALFRFVIAFMIVQLFMGTILSGMNLSFILQVIFFVFSIITLCPYIESIPCTIFNVSLNNYFYTIPFLIVDSIIYAMVVYLIFFGMISIVRLFIINGEKR